MSDLLALVAMALIAGIGVWAAHEMKVSTMAALDTIRQVTETAIQAATPPADAIGEHQPEQQAASSLGMDEIDWDPTDAAFGLADDTYEQFVPRFGNEGQPVATHPLGIPGLERPYPAVVADPEATG